MFHATQSIKERKEETATTPFKPHPLLIATENAFQADMHAIEKSMHNDETLISVSLEEFSFVEMADQKIDLANKKLIDFFKTTLTLLKLSIDSKKLDKAKAKENALVLARLKARANLVLNDLCEKHPELWDYLLKKKSGRHALYYHCYIDYIHNENEIKEVKWRDAFLSNSLAKNEIFILEYFNFIVNNETSDIAIHEFSDIYNLKNPILKAHFLIHIIHAYDLKLDELNELSNDLLVLDENVPESIRKLIQNRFACHLLMEVDKYPERMPEFLLLIKKLATKNYLPNVLANMPLSGNEQLNSFQYLYQLYQYCDKTQAHYTVSNYFSANKLTESSSSLLCMSISYFAKIKDIQIDKKIIKKLPFDILSLLKTGQIVISTTEAPIFWEANMKLFAHLIDMPEFITELNSTIDYLFHKNNSNCAFQLLKIYIKAVESKDKTNNEHRSLCNTIYLIENMPTLNIAYCKNVPMIETMRRDFHNLLLEVNTIDFNINDLNSDFLKQFQYLPQALRLKLLDRINTLKSMIVDFKSRDSDFQLLIKLDHLMHNVLHALQIPQTKFADSEEKKVEHVATQFTPDPACKEYEAYLHSYFLHIDNCVRNMEGTRPSFPERPTAIASDINSQLLIDYYNQMIDLLKLVDNVKSTKAPATDLFEHLKNINLNIINLKENNTLLWNYILSNKVCIKGLYYLLFNRMVNTASGQESARFLINIISKCDFDKVDGGNSANVINEKRVLEFFEFILNKLYDEANGSESTDNILIHLYNSFTIMTNQNASANKRMAHILAETSESLLFNSRVPRFIIQLIQQIFVEEFTKNVFLSSEKIPLYLPLITQLSESGYFPSCLATLDGNTHQTIVAKFFNLTIFNEILNLQYVFSMQRSATLFKAYNNYVHYEMIMLFQHISLSALIPDDTIKTIGGSAYSIIYYGNNIVANQLDQFIQSVVKMLSFLKRDVFFTEINMLMNKLFANGNIYYVKLFLKEFTNYLKNNDKKVSIDFSSMFEFMIDICLDSNSSTMVNADNVDAYFIQHNKTFSETLNKISKDCYRFDSLSNNKLVDIIYGELLKKCKEHLIQQMNLQSEFMIKYSGHKHFFAFQNKVLKLAEILKIDQDKLLKLRADIGISENIDFDDTDFNEQKKCKPTKAKKNKRNKSVKKEPQNIILDPIADPAPASEEVVIAAAPEVQATVAVSPMVAPTVSIKIPSLTPPLSPQQIAMSIIQHINQAEDWEEIKKKPKPPKLSSTHHYNSTQTIPKSSTFQTVQTKLLKNPTPVIKKLPTDTQAPAVLPFLQAGSMFKVSDDDKISINRDQLPIQLNNFSTHVRNLCDENLILTGGAVTSLILKDTVSDFDCVILANLAHLFKLLNAHKNKTIYDCELIKGKFPIIKVLLVKECICDCDVIFMPEIPLRDLSNVSINSEAAYIRTPKGLYYVNKIKNVWVELVSIQGKSANSSINKTLLKSFDKQIETADLPRELRLIELHKIKKLTGHTHADLIEMDITYYDEPHYKLGKKMALKEILAKRDFKIAALSAELKPGNATCEINGFNGAVRSVKQELISAVDPVILFRKQTDLIRIFRLVKLRCKYPKFEMDDELKKILRDTDFNLFFDNFIFKQPDEPSNITHLRQINTKLNDLFSKFDPKTVLSLLCELKIVNGMTGISDYAPLLATADVFSRYIDTLPHDFKKSAFYHFIYAHTCHSPSKHHKNELLDRVKITLEPKFELREFNAHLSFIEKRPMLSVRSHNTFSPSVEFSNMMLDIKQYYLNPPLNAPAHNSSKFAL